MAQIFISCAEAARRISLSHDALLSRSSRIGLWLHLAVCRFCRRYSRQVQFLRKVLREPSASFEPGKGELLSEEARERILQRLREGGDSASH